MNKKKNKILIYWSIIHSHDVGEISWIGVAYQLSEMLELYNLDLEAFKQETQFSRMMLEFLCPFGEKAMEQETILTL